MAAEPVPLAPVDMSGVHPEDRLAMSGVVGRIADQQVGDVAVTHDEVQVIVLDEGVDKPRRLFVRPAKRRVTRHIWRWLEFLKTVNASNGVEQMGEVFRCIDELLEILTHHVVGWENIYEGGELVPFSANCLEDVLDINEDVMHAAGQLFALSTMGTMQKKRSGSPSPVNGQGGAGSRTAGTGGQQSGPLSTRSALDASLAKDDIPGGSGGSTPSGGTPPPSSALSSTAPKPPPPLNPASD